ncbi:uncharacterized protein A4U43_C02F21930 [Asparagus officinalis]|uniref:Uncharacterized protein n=1 Tax=Asparagus officinalis TaxID=4686 RepID=A0A5P1FQ04_ASPOF|nr:uncharacterized protein A4U43_C02F21930 [Asparagus officinalis]
MLTGASESYSRPKAQNHVVSRCVRALSILSQVKITHKSNRYDNKILLTRRGYNSLRQLLYRPNFLHTFHPKKPPPSSYLPLSQISPILAPNSSFLLLLPPPPSLSSSSLLPAAAECFPAPHPYTALLRDYLPLRPSIRRRSGRIARIGAKASPVTASISALPPDPLSDVSHVPQIRPILPLALRSPLRPLNLQRLSRHSCPLARLDSVKSAAAKAAGSVGHTRWPPQPNRHLPPPQIGRRLSNPPAAIVTAAAPKSVDAVKSAAGSVAETVAAATPKASGPVRYRQSCHAGCRQRRSQFCRPDSYGRHQICHRPRRIPQGNMRQAPRPRDMHVCPPDRRQEGHIQT